MKKTLSFIAMICCMLGGMHSYAQYNKTFYNTQNGSMQATDDVAIDIINVGNGSTCVLTKNIASDYDFTLKIIDYTGAVTAYETFTISQSDYISPGKLLLAPNGEILVSGYYTTTVPTRVVNPFAARFSVVGGAINCLWFKLYPSNTGIFSLSTTLSRVNIVEATDWPTEAYILVGAGDNSGTPYNDQTINALLIDANGALQWNKKYYENTPSRFRMIAPRALTRFDGDMMQKYYIAGYMNYNVTIQRGFDMAIDVNGNIVNPYRDYYVPTYPFGHDAIYDASTGEIVLTYTMGDNNIAGAPVVSEIAVTKMQANNLAIISTDYYYEDDPSAVVSENYSNTIVLDAANSNYIINAFNYNDNMNYKTACILKIDKASNVQFYKRYNKLTATDYGAITSVVDPFAVENYVAVCNTANTTTPDSRVFSTNTAGVTCGDDNINYKQGTYNLMEKSYTFTDTSLLGEMLIPYTTGYSYSDSLCDNSNPDYKQSSNVVFTTSSSGFTAYPTLLTDAGNNITLSGISTNTAMLHVTITGIDGKVLYREVVKLEQGNNNLKLAPGLSANGTYVLTATSDDGRINIVKRITKI